MDPFWNLDIYQDFPPKRKKVIVSLIYSSIILSNYSHINLLLNNKTFFRNFITKTKTHKMLIKTHLNQDFKYFKAGNFKKLISPKMSTNTTNIGISVDSNNKLISLFKTFIKLTLFRGNTYFNKTSSLKFLFTSPNSRAFTTSLNKSFSKWKNFYSFFFNLYYYDIKFLTFSNSFFTREVLALNWLSFSNENIRSIWRFIQPFLLYKLGQIVNYGGFLFRKLRLSGLNIGLVIDLLYHNKTLYYLNLNHFFIISLVSSSSRFKNIDLVLPVNTNSIFSQLFFIRFLLLIKKDSQHTSYRSFKNTWTSLLKSL